MKFPDERGAQYETCAYILADTVTGISGQLSTQTREAWAMTMSRLATADDISEVTPEVFTAPESLLSYLGLDESNGTLVRTAQRLLDANLASMGAASIRDHFDARALEAEASVDLLRFQSPPELARHHYVWGQLGSIATVGIHIDSIIDSHTDAEKSPFTTSELVLGAMGAITRVVPRIDPKTWYSVARASHRYGLDYRVVKKGLASI